MAEIVIINPRFDTSFWGLGNGLAQAILALVFRAAADEGNANGQYELGVMYAEGRRVPQDYTKALQWFRRAADQGNAGAQHNLGLMYANGQGVPKDNTLAYMWLSLSAAAGAQDAPNALDLIVNQMTPKQIAKAQKLVHEWQPDGAST
jgi:uncharacterized protein